MRKYQRFESDDEIGDEYDIDANAVQEHIGGATKKRSKMMVSEVFSPTRMSVVAGKRGFKRDSGHWVMQWRTREQVASGILE